MSLLTILQSSADELKISRPSTIIGNTNPEVQELLRYANKVGKNLMVVFDWQILKKEVTYTSVATEEQTSILPSDFDRFCPETFWNRTDQYLISGPITDVQWQGLKATTYSDTYYPKFRYRGDSVYIIPTMTAGKSLAFEYISNQWCQSSGGSGQTEWAVDTDTGILDEELITKGVVYEWLESNGQPSASAGFAYQDYFRTLAEQDNPVTEILVGRDIDGGGRHFTGHPPSTNNSILF